MLGLYMDCLLRSIVYEGWMGQNHTPYKPLWFKFVPAWIPLFRSLSKWRPIDSRSLPYDKLGMEKTSCIEIFNKAERRYQYFSSKNKYVLKWEKYLHFTKFLLFTNRFIFQILYSAYGWPYEFSIFEKISKYELGSNY